MHNVPFLQVITNKYHPRYNIRVNLVTWFVYINSKEAINKTNIRSQSMSTIFDAYQRRQVRLQCSLRDRHYTETCMHSGIIIQKSLSKFCLYFVVKIK